MRAATPLIIQTFLMLHPAAVDDFISPKVLFSLLSFLTFVHFVFLPCKRSSAAVRFLAQPVIDCLTGCWELCVYVLISDEKPSLIHLLMPG